MNAATAIATSPIETDATPSLIAGLSGVPTSFKAVALACLNVRGGRLVMTLPDGRTLLFGSVGGTRVHMRLVNFGFAKRVLASGDIGFAESYMAKEWETPDLPGLLTFLADNAERIIRIFQGNPLYRLAHWMRHMGNANTKQGSKRNILAHYDLGNDFYRAWLDPSMTYSSARWDTIGADAPLKDAQAAKYRALARHLDLKPGETVLEIGCGWGGFAEVAAKEFGAKVTGLTISNAQLAFAQERIAAQGLNDKVELRLQDYRDVVGDYDKVASIEMFEAVGEQYWGTYFQKVRDVLRPGGRAALQVITIQDDLFETYRQRADFIQRYVFPGGMLASVGRLKEEVAKAGLGWAAMDRFGPSYARTLNEWSHTFLSRWEDVKTLGFDERFKQLWNFYLGYCEAGFRTGRTDVIQLALTRP
ncbi:MAG: class I SAM-dependent methyltransferase [Caulobacterales bacterium]|jgi:cyclopropane-fatty-acyl-phospholipid synthase